LKKLIFNHPKGLEENEELYLSYTNCENDLKKFKADGYVRELYNKKEKKTMLFPIVKE
jgi:hypothetical protein